MIKYVTDDADKKKVKLSQKYCSMTRIYMSEPSEESSHPAFMKVGVGSEL